MTVKISLGHFPGLDIKSHIDYNMIHTLEVKKNTD